MKLTSLFVFLLLFCAVRASPQEIGQIFKARETFEGGTVMIKVIVCTEDQSVWALDNAYKVYYKPGGGTEFDVYGPTSNLQVRDLAGYNANEMFFLSTDKLYESKSMGELTEIAVPGTSPINNIAVVEAQRNVYLEGYHGKRDWLAVATKSVVQSLFRDDGLFGLAFTPISTGSTPDCRITNSGFKSLDIQYTYVPNSQCFGPVDHVYYNKVGSVTTETILPEEGLTYTGRVNCTYFEAPFNQVKDGNKPGFDYWGTDKGLFVKNSGGCGLDNVRKKLDVKINDLKELNFFRDIFNNKIMLAAAADGLYVTTDIFSPDAITPLEKIGFQKLYNFDVGVNSIAVETRGFAGAVNGEGNGLCETAVWLATANGIVKIPMGPASKNVSKDTFGLYGELVSVSAGLRTYYCVSSGEEYTFTANLPNDDQTNYTVQWYRDPEIYANRVELEDLRGQNPVTFSDRGEYGVRITSKCGEYINIGNFWLRDPEPVTIEFNYPEVVNMFAGCTFKFTANAGNQYKWEKDGQFLSETSNVLEATEPGVYRLFYYDRCSEDYVPLPPVELKEIDVANPVITRSNNLSLCFGEKVMLSVDDPGVEGITYKWQRNGQEIPGKTSREIEVDQPGNYAVDLVLGEGCGKRSATAEVVINDELKLTTPPAVQICTMRAQRLRLTAPEGFSTYTWDGVAGTANFFEVTAPGQYTLEVEDASGCKAGTLYVVVPYCSPPVPPNAFSPNGDGINDIWTVGGLEDDPNAVIHVYNRYGTAVFEGSAQKPSWNGKFEGTDVPAGIYYFVVTKKSVRSQTGSLALIR